ncbi:MAG TPA: hypothetical protein VFC84_05290 [Desulfosporosinus sp.]|nr:hypothetical protein [Desulfosporosinus sp.]
MGKISLLDCTLRDGGYINDWNFGENSIQDIEHKIVSTGVEIFEIGFLKDEPYINDRTVFNSVHQISDIIGPKLPDVQYAAMIEVVNPLPIEKLEQRAEETIDIIRVIVWKSMLQEGFDYCKGVVERGYKLCVQPARVDQYSFEEFIQMIKLFNKLDPMAVYVVDSFGTQNKDAILEYFILADDYLKPEIALGYHGHNNLQQAFGIAEAFIELGLKRDIIVDGSIYGIGRGAGNLNLELFAKYLNEKHGKSYRIGPMLDVFDKYIQGIFADCPWGYSLPSYLTALHRCNPNYASYYGLELKLTNSVIDGILSSLSKIDKIIFKKENADRYLSEYRKK